MKSGLEMILGIFGLGLIAFGCLYALQSFVDGNAGLPDSYCYKELIWGFLLLTSGMIIWGWLIKQPPGPKQYNLVTTTKERKSNGKKS